MRGRLMASAPPSAAFGDCYLPMALPQGGLIGRFGMRQTSKATVKKARGLRREMSLPEVMLWQHLRGRPGGVKFRRQHPVGIYVADFMRPMRG